jgi:ABC-type branched-subunit amino acid transport system ATPase component
MSAVLEAHDVAVHFGGVKAVDGVSFELTEGKIFGILGPNGSGKSTLLGALTRLVPLTRGELTLDGESFNKVSAADVARRRVARTFQTVRLLQDLTVLENVQLGGELRQPDPRPGQALRRRPRSDPADPAQRPRAVAPERVVVRDPAPRRDRPRARHAPQAAPARRADGRHEPG